MSISLNSPTALMISRGLAKIAAKEVRHGSPPGRSPCCLSPRPLEAQGIPASPGDFVGLAESSGCDMRSAVNSLQVALGLGSRQAGGRPRARARGGGGAAAKPRASSGKRKGPVQEGEDFARDAFTSAFHGLGRILYNKREVPPTPGHEAAQQGLRSELRRWVGGCWKGEGAGG